MRGRCEQRGDGYRPMCVFGGHEINRRTKLPPGGVARGQGVAPALRSNLMHDHGLDAQPRRERSREHRTPCFLRPLPRGLGCEVRRLACLCDCGLAVAFVAADTHGVRAGLSQDMVSTKRKALSAPRLQNPSRLPRLLYGSHACSCDFFRARWRTSSPQRGRGRRRGPSKPARASF